jgi:lactoylglutathione lyase
VELTYNWDQAEPYETGRFFGHLAYEVDDIYAVCTRLLAAGSRCTARLATAAWRS